MTETGRILALPRVEHRPDTTQALALEAALGRNGSRLLPAQRAALAALHYAHHAGPGPWGPRGMAGLIGCGHGKTLVAQLAPRVCHSQRPLLLLPASLLRQLAADVAEWRGRFDLAEPPAVSYELLSTPGGRDLVARHHPDLLILDEAHLLASPTSARWKRIARYLRRHPECRVVVLSGTLTWKRLGQMRHLLVAALRDWSPVPADGTAELWGMVLDVGGEPSTDARRVFAPVLEWAAQQSPETPGVSDATGGRTGERPRECPTPLAGGLASDLQRSRWAFRERLATAPGVVVTHGVAADVSLRMRRWDPGVHRSTAGALALANLQDLWELPDGTQLVEALEYFRHGATLSLGFYTRWVPGTLDPEWDEARREWAQAQRRGCEYLGYDSPALVTEAAVAGQADSRTLAAWRAWSEPRADGVAYRDWPTPPTETVWVDPDYLRDTVWTYLDRCPERRRGGLIWVRSRAVGEALADPGLPYHGLGSPPPAGGPALASLPVHGKGWNGQRYTHQLVLEPPSSAAAWEQVLARTHRTGQDEDVTAWVLCAAPAQRIALEVGLAGARYTRDSTGAPQRLLMADWEG